MNKQKSMDARFEACTVTTKGRGKTDIPAGIHRVIDNAGVADGGVTIAWAGKHIDISYDEWKRLGAENLVKEA